MVSEFTIGLIKKRFAKKIRLPGAFHAGQHINATVGHAPADFAWELIGREHD